MKTKGFEWCSMVKRFITKIHVYRDESKHSFSLKNVARPMRSIKSVFQRNFTVGVLIFPRLNILQVYLNWTYNLFMGRPNLKRLLMIGSVMVKVNTCPCEVKESIIYKVYFFCLHVFVDVVWLFQSHRAYNKLVHINDFISCRFCTILI